MKKLIIIVTSLFFFFSCRTANWHYDKRYREFYVDVFKRTYFNKLLRAGFNNSSAIREVQSKDLPPAAEPILLEEDELLIDSLVTVANREMIADSLMSITRRAEGAKGKRIMYYALDKYTSKWLADLAKQRSKLYIKKSKIY